MIEARNGSMKKYTNKGSRLGIIRYILHPYCFSLKYHYLKSSRDVRYTLSLAYCPCLCTFSYCHPYFNHQFYSIVFYACNNIRVTYMYMQLMPRACVRWYMNEGESCDLVHVQ